MFPYNMAFVHSNGDDNTAEVGNINKPFSTLQEAINVVKLTDFPVIQIMSDLNLNAPITTPENKDIIINLYNGVTINFTNSLHGSSLFTINTNVSITLVSNGSSKFICESGTYLSSFATLRMGTLKLQNINVIHNIKISSLNDKSISGTENGSHVIEKSDIRDIKKVKVFSSIIVATVAICAVIFTPI